MAEPNATVRFMMPDGSEKVRLYCPLTYPDSRVRFPAIMRKFPTPKNEAVVTGKAVAPEELSGIASEELAPC